MPSTQPPLPRSRRAQRSYGGASVKLASTRPSCSRSSVRRQHRGPYTSMSRYPRTTSTTRESLYPRSPTLRIRFSRRNIPSTTSSSRICSSSSAVWPISSSLVSTGESRSPARTTLTPCALPVTSPRHSPILPQVCYHQPRTCHAAPPGRPRHHSGKGCVRRRQETSV